MEGNRPSLSPFPFSLSLLSLLLLPAVARAQDSVIVIDPDEPAADSTALGIPPAILEELLATWNDSATVRLPGGLVLPPGARLGGPVASYRASVRASVNAVKEG